jgi:hypothetical protein
MAKMWKGPCEALKASYSCPIAVRLARRAGEQHIAYDTDHSGTRATVWRMERRSGEWCRVDLGTAEGADPMNTYINVALEFTRHDQELFSLIAAQIDKRAEEVISVLRDLVKRADAATDDLREIVGSLASRV